MTQTHTNPGANGRFIFLGVLLIFTGIVALIFPYMATLSVEILVGSAFLVGGIITIFHAFAERQWGGFFWQLAIGIIQGLAGFALLAMPITGVIALTVMLGFVFTAEGIARMILAFQVRPDRAWGLILAAGGISLLLGILVLAGLANGASLAFIGLLVGINFVFAGASLVAVGTGHADPAAARTA